EGGGRADFSQRCQYPFGAAGLRAVVVGEYGDVAFRADGTDRTDRCGQRKDQPTDGGDGHGAHAASGAADPHRCNKKAIRPDQVNAKLRRSDSRVTYTWIKLPTA